MNDSAEFINDESKINLQPGDLFDRIINLKLTCYDAVNRKAEEFVIRSDYELILPDSNFSNEGNRKGFIIRKCTHKPSIKVQCKMVTSNVGTSIDVFVSNFFLLTADGKHLRSFNSQQYKISSVEIVMGYWGQLKDSLNPDTDNADDYYDIKAINGADRIVINGGKPIIVTTEKLPPDSAIHIKGYVGDIYSSPVAISTVKTPSKALEKPVASSGTEFEQVLFDNITRRYINGNIRLRENNASDVLSYNMVAPVSPEDSAKGIAIGNKVVKPDSETGLLSESDAKAYGVKVYLSDEAKKVQILKTYDSEDNEVDKNIYFEPGWTIGMTISRIMSYMDKELEYTFSLDGDVLIYTPTEMQDTEALSKAFHTQGLYDNTVLANKELYNNRLPAVYNINIDAVATIVCPFFTFIQPFQYVEFASRYALTSLVSYYAQYKPTISRFLVISASISFATVDDVNEVQLTAVSARDSIV